MAVIYANKRDVLGATFSGYALTGPSTGAYVFQRVAGVVTPGTGSTFTVDGGRGTTLSATITRDLANTPISDGIPQALAAGITLTPGQVFYARASTAGVVDFSIDYQHITN